MPERDTKRRLSQPSEDRALVVPKPAPSVLLPILPPSNMELPIFID